MYMRVPSAIPALLLALGCQGPMEGFSTVPPPALPEPAVQSVGPEGIAVGDDLVIEGTGFLDDERGYTVITFRGEFLKDDGSVEDVDFQVVPVVDTPEQARWTFGPHRVPFGQVGNQIGRFEGRVFAENVPADGTSATVAQTAPIDSILKVQPSIVVGEFQPEGATCAIVSKTILNQIPYRLQVEAVGFEPTRFTYVFSPGLVPEDDETGSLGEHVIVHDGSAAVDELRQDELIRFAEVPVGLVAYRGSISIRADARNGAAHELALKLTVRRPMEIAFNQAVHAVEIFDPAPVSGCIPGGMNGRMVNYSESQTETRERSLQLGWQQDWMSSYTEGHSENYTEGDSHSNRVGFTTTDENSYSWNWHGEASGQLNLTLFGTGAVLGGGGGGGEERGNRHSEQSTTEEAWETSRSYGESLQESNTIQDSMGQNGSEAFRVSSSESQALQFSAFLLPEMFGVFYRQTTRLVRPGSVIAYDACGEGIVVGEVAFDDYTWAPDLALGTACPPFPVSSLPPAQCLSPPCQGS